MKGFSRRDYIVAGGIITGVLAIWFLLMATLMRIIDPQIGIFMVVIAGGLVWFLLSKKKD